MPHVIGRAMGVIADATAAGADSIAPDAMRAARQHLSAATAEAHAKHADHADLWAREAIADASYAKAVADRAVAVRARADAAAALDQSSTQPTRAARAPSPQ